MNKCKHLEELRLDCPRLQWYETLAACNVTIALCAAHTITECCPRSLSAEGCRNLARLEVGSKQMDSLQQLSLERCRLIDWESLQPLVRSESLTYLNVEVSCFPWSLTLHLAAI